VEWVPLEEDYDVVSIGYGNDNRQYKVLTGLDKWKAELLEKFPTEQSAIRKWFDLMSELKEKKDRLQMPFLVLLKIMPLWLSWFLDKTGLLNLITPTFRKKYDRTTLDILSELTDNDDLKTVLLYISTVICVPPNEFGFPCHTSCQTFYSAGSCYPKGGASEIAFNMIPIVERAGGKVLCGASVQKIIHDGQKVVGVTVKRVSTGDIRYHTACEKLSIESHIKLTLLVSNVRWQWSRGTILVS
jgi:all-trans-retinol 13,14-reductase